MTVYFDCVFYFGLINKLCLCWQDYFFSEEILKLMVNEVQLSLSELFHVVITSHLAAFAKSVYCSVLLLLFKYTVCFGLLYSQYYDSKWLAKRTHLAFWQF